jgi:HEAT repeat protein
MPRIWTLAAFLIAFPIHAAEPEPSLAGKPVAEWVKALQGKELPPRLEALGTLARLAGPASKSATPALIEVFRDGDAPFLHPLAGVALSRIGAGALPELKKALTDRDASVRAGAVLAMSLMGPRATPATSALADVVKKDADARIRALAASALGAIGSEAKVELPAVRAALDDRDTGVRIAAASAVWKVGREADAGVKVLTAALTEDPDTASRAAKALLEIGPAAKAAEPALTKALERKEPVVRTLCAFALWRVGGPLTLEKVSKVLEESAKDKDEEVRQLVMVCAGEVTGASRLLHLDDGKSVVVRRAAASALPGLYETHREEGPGVELKHDDPGVRWWAAVAHLNALGAVKSHEYAILEILRSDDFSASRTSSPWVDTDAARAVPALERILARRSTVFKIEAARAIGQFGPDARRALPTLIKTLSTGDKLVRRAVADSLAQLGPDVVPVLTDSLGSATPGLREGAARALGEMGELARPAVDRLAALAKAKPDEANTAVRVAAAVALWRITNVPEPTLAVLQMVLADLDYPDRWEAIEGIVEIAEGARPPIRGLTEVLLQAAKDRDARVRIFAVRGLWRREQRAATVLPLLTELLADSDVFVRQTAVQTLGELPPSTNVIAPLLRALEDRDVGVRVAALFTLVHGGTGAVPHLVKALSSKVEKIRVGAADALRRIRPDSKAEVAKLIDVVTRLGKEGADRPTLEAERDRLLKELLEEKK